MSAVTGAVPLSVGAVVSTALAGLATALKLVGKTARLPATSAIALPSFTTSIRNSRLASTTNEFIAAVNLARSEAVKAAADELHAQLLALGVDVILDDRGERPGAMFADWELIGVPHRVVLGDKGLKEGLAELQGRQEAEATKVPVAELLNQLRARLQLA